MKNIFARSHTEHHWRCSHVLKLLSHSTGQGWRCDLLNFRSKGIIEWRISKPDSMFRLHQDLTCWISYSKPFLCSDLTWTSNLHEQPWWPHKADLMQPFSCKWGIHGLQIWTQDLENVCDAHQFMWPSGLDLSSILGQKCMSYVCYCKAAACS